MKFAVPLMLLFGQLCYLGAEEKIIFSDDFNRADAKSPGNEWKVYTANDSAVLIDGESIYFETTDEEFHPALSHTFERQTTGTVKVSFDFDWMRESEGDWGFYMQLGDSKIMADEDLNKGVAVNLVWGGGFSLDADEIAAFGHFKGSTFTKLTNINNAEEKSTIVKNAKIEIEIDLDKKTYAVQLNGKKYEAIPFSADAEIDNIRFVANNVNTDNFSSKSIDSVKISK